MSDWVKVQAEDQVTGNLIQWYKARELHKDKDTDSPEMKQFLKQRGKLLLRNGILYCKYDTQETECLDRNTMQLILPTMFRIQALKGCHDDLGHLGIERTLDFLREWFYWPSMTEDATRHIKQCERCLQFKASPNRAPMENVDATYPMELVHMDYLMIEANKGGKDVHILVITDHFTWYAQAIVTSLQTVKCTVQNLWDKFIVHYGLLEKILTDQGHNFESDLLKALCEIAQVKKIETSGYHPQTNGQCKHFNVTLINMLGTLPEKPKSTQREKVLTLVHAYNCTRNNAMGFSPYYLMFRGKPCLPIDLILGTNTANLKGSSINYIENLKKRMAWAYQTANDVIKKEQERNKQCYDCKVWCTKFMVGDKVLLRHTAYKVCTRSKIIGKIQYMKL